MDKIKENPWRGLEAYQDGEILYGRDDDIKSLSQYVVDNVDTVLYGRSGIGKSSLINAGIIPAARRSGFHSLSIHLVHEGNTEHDGDVISYVRQIRNAIRASGVSIKEISQHKGNTELIWELFHRNEFYDKDGNRCNLLIILDQFEEIFTLQKQAEIKRAFFAEMADMLNDIQPSSLSITKESKEEQKENIVNVASPNGIVININNIGFKLDSATNEFVEDNNIHFVFTLREDFLSDFEYYTSAIPSLKQHRYGLRPINDEQAAEIILRPRIGLVAKDVAKLIIQKVTQRIDFDLDGIPEIEVDSAVLSLYLSRLYEEKKSDSITAELVEEKGGEIISSFYSKCIENIDEAKVKFLEDTLVNDEGRRENKSESSITKEIGQNVVNHLIDVKLLRRFSYASNMRIEFIHDILCPVVKQRKEQREQLRLQEEERKKQEEEHNKLIQQQQHEKHKFRITIFSSVATIALIVGCIFAYYYWTEWLHVSYYTQIEYVKGWPKGIGQNLNASQREHTPLYYKLSHKGHLSHETDIEVMSSNPKLPKGQRLTRLEYCNDENDAAGQAYNRYIERVKKVQFKAGENGRVDKEIMIDDNDSVLFIISYFYESENNAWAQFLYANGTPMKIRQENEIDRMKITWDEGSGQISSLRYYDASGACSQIDNGISGFFWKRPSENLTLRYNLDALGLPTQTNLYNAISTYRNGDTIDVRYYKAFDTESVLAQSQEVENEDGLARCQTIGGIDYIYKKGETKSSAYVVTTTDNHGNILTREVKGQKPTLTPALVRYTYHKTTGYLTQEEKYDGNNNNYGHAPTDIYKKCWSYDDKGNLQKEVHIAQNNDTAYKYVVTYKHVDKYNTKERTTEIFRMLPTPSYVVRIDTIGHSTSFYGKHGKMINQKVAVGNAEDKDSILCHRVICEKHDSITTYTYYVYDENIDQEIKAPTRYKDGYKAISYYQRVESKDTKGNIQWMQLKDENLNILKSMKYIIQGGEVIGRGAMGIDGDFVRCPHWEEDGFVYYKMYFTKDFINKYIGLRAYDEFSLPSGFRYVNGFYYVEVFKYLAKEYNIVGKDKKTGKDIDVKMMNDYKQYEFKTVTTISTAIVPYLHLLSRESTLYKMGLKDNDQIIAIGTWHYGMPIEIFRSQWQRFSIKGEHMPIDVLRYEKRALHRKHFVITSEGNTLWAEYHLMALTHKEEEIFDKAKQ